MFSISFSNQAQDFIKKSEKELMKRLIRKLELLKEEPVPHDAKTIEGFGNKLFRVRVGGYRILYEVYYSESLIVVSKIDKRSRVYD